METDLNILIIEDHPLISHAYSQAAEKVGEELGKSIRSLVLADIPQVLKMFKDKTFFNKLDLIFLDISLPMGDDEKFLSGEDLGVYIRKEFPDVKIIVSTAFTNNFRLHNVITHINPRGLLVKNDVSSKDLSDAIQDVLNDKIYYSNGVLKLIRSQMGSDVSLDNSDRRLLYELSIGTKMKDLPSIIPLSIAGIERRKRNLKLIFEVEKDSDRDLILKAKQYGFI